MESSDCHGRPILSKFLHMFVLISCLSAGLAITDFGNETDRLALLDLKRRITKDPLRIMSSWNDSVDFCSWIGVTCHHSTKRVMILDLEAQELVGSLPHSIGNLTYLTGINLRHNHFRGEILQEMGRLRSLQYLNMSYNSFVGKIPTNISYCTQLKMLDVNSNMIIGSIPDQLSSLLNLTHLWVYGNNLTGTIPSWIGNFSSLNTLYLDTNNFQGSIPNEFGRLTSLGKFVLGLNNLSGIVPSSIYNISSIYIFDVTQNQLHGELPPNVGISLPNLEQFYISLNKFTGAFPLSLANASRLQSLDFSLNGLTGTLPAESLGSLQSLVWLNVDRNKLGSGKTGDLNFLSFLANCTSLEMLGLHGNRFGGELPGSIANLSTHLKYLTLGKNLLHGSIPNGIGNLENLILLVLEYNELDGSFPEGIGKLRKLEAVYLGSNRFSGPIPSLVGNFTSLTKLFMDGNQFEGSIPPSLGNCKKLLILNLSSNCLTGTIPKELVQISSLSISLIMSYNYLTGSLPSEVGDLVNLAELDVSRNKLSGEIPVALGSCTSLLRLYLEGNEFEGRIPQSLKALRGMEEIDMSRNNLSGQIPEFLGNFMFLMYLNLSHNDFEGELPKEGIFSNASGISILGNDRVCGGIPQLLLPACSNKKPHSSHGLLKEVIPITCALALVIVVSCFIVARSRRKLVTLPSHKDWKLGVSYSELVESTNGFSMANLIGMGSFGSVYKGIIPIDGTVVAVKVLNLQQEGAFNSFIRECNALRSIRHRNLLKIITVCSSIDNQGDDFKSLVFEYMENGSLDAWLHPIDDENSEMKRLSLVQRLNIAIDVASALDYLHHHCDTPIVHCDLKPSNVLLDEDMVAHVGDFGLARFLLEASDDPSHSQTMSTGLKGSIGYIPPENGTGGQVSTLGDVYSFGILLLEMFTGKRPTDDMFKDGLSIHQFTASSMHDHVLEIIDPALLNEGEDDDNRCGNETKERPFTRYLEQSPVQGRRLEECLVSVMQLGLACSAITPGERMLMNVVVNKMKTIRDSYI
ncbi:hypothetical protein C1H46_012642 [Malus baccata]|uniref:non-specific serine/threonine protein kinase n=1 Tax=Malus baccata TaxID=106549 RepID=A0A540MSF1_MALBA|nr:hypothetical protein C1H46_012642 [Malus baccata]